jgi:hypothetical protein
MRFIFAFTKNRKFCVDILGVSPFRVDLARDLYFNWRVCLPDRYNMHNESDISQQMLMMPFQMHSNRQGYFNIFL